MDIYVRDGSIIVSGVSCFDLARSCDCGQAFRWKNTGNGWSGVAGGRLVPEEIRKEYMSTYLK